MRVLRFGIQPAQAAQRILGDITVFHTPVNQPLQSLHFQQHRLCRQTCKLLSANDFFNFLKIKVAHPQQPKFLNPAIQILLRQLRVLLLPAPVQSPALAVAPGQIRRLNVLDRSFSLLNSAGLTASSRGAHLRLKFVCVVLSLLLVAPPDTFPPFAACILVFEMPLGIP
ncbi:MAG TPA: hypothetical protein VGP72_18975 [Planctomycetota bacterium]